jgi:hypothetical protein
MPNTISTASSAMPAIDALANLYFTQMTRDGSDLVAFPAVGADAALELLLRSNGASFDDLRQTPPHEWFNLGAQAAAAITADPLGAEDALRSLVGKLLEAITERREEKARFALRVVA